MSNQKKEKTWHTNKAEDSAEDSALAREKCTRQFARTVIRSVRFPLSPAETGRYTVGSATQSAKIASVKKYNNLVPQRSIMKITVFNSSPRGERSNTNIMVQAVLEGAKDAGAECENIFLAGKNIKPCLGCFACWIKTPGKCVIKDDMAELLDKTKEPDIIIFATPLYVDNVSGIMKNFMDRSIPLSQPYFKKDEQGEYRHETRDTKPPKIAVISNCGFPEQSHFQVLKLLFRRLARNMSSELIAEIYRGEGELLKVDFFLLKPVINKYKNLLKTAGREMVENLKLSDKTMQELEKPLIPYDMYISSATKEWNQALKKSCA